MMTDGLGPLYVAVLERFIPQFAPQAKALFLRGNGDHPLIFVPDVLQRLGVPVDKINRLPDAVFFLSKHRLLVLLELSTLITVKQRN